MDTPPPRRKGRIFGDTLSPALVQSPVPSISSTPPLGPTTHGRSPSFDFDAFAASNGPNTLFCPICSEVMVSLLQLNRHLDDAHSSIPSTQKDNLVKSWIRKHVKTKNLPPVISALNQKLNTSNKNGLINEDDEDQSSQRSGSVQSNEFRINTNHFKPINAASVCCKDGKRMAQLTNCTKCGKIYCIPHVQHSMKLGRDAEWSPENGKWARVCESCFTSRPSYNDTNQILDHTAPFIRMRRQKVEKDDMERNRLDKRLNRLLQLLASEFTKDNSRPGTIRASSYSRRSLEQSVVVWESDAGISVCPFCKVHFSFSNRKHHCRLCGRVVCGDINRACSLDVGIDIKASSENRQHLSVQEKYTLDVRLCKDCRGTVFDKRDFEADVGDKTRPIIGLYTRLRELKRNIESMLPMFENMVTKLSEDSNPPTNAQIKDASGVRKKLVELFSQFDSTAKKIALLPAGTNVSVLRMQSGIAQWAALYLQVKMVPLQSLPKAIRAKASSNSSYSPSITDSDTSNTNISDARFKQVKEQMIVLQEQQFLVNGMIEDANKRRKFEEADVLRLSLTELETEIYKLEKELG